jgi:AcrR family transcriptional regulator
LTERKSSRSTKPAADRAPEKAGPAKATTGKATTGKATTGKATTKKATTGKAPTAKATTGKATTTKAAAAGGAASAKAASRNGSFRLAGERRGPAPTVGPRARRTTALIMATAREVFLAKGYHGLRIDDIADAAGVSRASFYTYFPSKRDLLVALGQQTFEATDRALDAMDALESGWTADRVYDLVRIYMKLLDDHGAFVLVWSQATYDDDELATAGVRARLSTGRRFGKLLQRLGGRAPSADDDPARFGLALLVMMDRYWSYWRVTGFPFSEEQVVETLGDIIAAVIDHQ